MDRYAPKKQREKREMAFCDYRTRDKDPWPECPNHIRNDQYAQGDHCWCTAVRRGGVNMVSAFSATNRCCKPLSARGLKLMEAQAKYVRDGSAIKRKVIRNNDDD